MIATIAEIEQFLQGFKQKVEIFDIIFWDERGKNTDALAALDIIPNQRKEIIKTITVTDYSEGPITNLLNQLGDYGYLAKKLMDKKYISRFVMVFLTNKRFVSRSMWQSTR